MSKSETKKAKAVVTEPEVKPDETPRPPARVPEPWGATWMTVARAVAVRSKDPSTQVGAVAVDWTNKRFLALGFNGPPPAVADSFDWADRGVKHPLVAHAESNCLWFGVEAHGRDALRQGYLYVTSKPCSRCVLECVRARVAKVVYDDTAVPARMLDDAEWERSQAVAKAGGVSLVPYSSVAGG